jgi:VCBS repeat-containing protein
MAKKFHTTPKKFFGDLTGARSYLNLGTVTGIAKNDARKCGYLWFKPQTIVGTHGTLTIAKTGAWVYTITNTALATKTTLETVTDTIAIRSLDDKAGTNIVITITGTA